MLTIDRCPCCGSGAQKTLFDGRTTRQPDNGDRWRLVSCDECHLAFLNPQPTWAELQAYYDSSYPAYASSHGAAETDESVIAHAERDQTFRHIPIPRGKTVLDVGTGGGYFLRICRKLGAETFGVEPNANAVRNARSQGLNVFHGSLHEYETDRRFDVITASQVLEHTPDPVSVLRKMRDLLSADGFIWISVPNFDCVWSRLLRWKWDGADLPYHLVHFGPESLKRAGKEAGLRVRAMKTQSLSGIVKYSAKKVLRDRLRIPERLGQMIVSDRWAGRYAAKLDANTRGDNLIVEFVPA